MNHQLTAISWAVLLFLWLTEGTNTAGSQGIIAQAEETTMEYHDNIVLPQYTIN